MGTGGLDIQCIVFSNIYWEGLPLDRLILGRHLPHLLITFVDRIQVWG